MIRILKNTCRLHSLAKRTFKTSAANYEKDAKNSSNETADVQDESGLLKRKPDENQVQQFELPHDDTTPKKHVFQELRKPQHPSPIYTIAEASEYASMENLVLYYRYNKLAQQHTDSEYALRGINNEDTIIFHFPEITDFVVVGGGLVGSATAYYMKKQTSRAADVIVLDKDPYSPHNNTALCNGLITSQSKSQDISRIGTLSKELIRTLKNDLVVTNEDFLKINYRPCTHLILWPESEIPDVMKSIELQMEDGLYTEAKLPGELEASYPWLRAIGTDVGLGTHGNQDEALVDPIALRNLYRTLAQAYGVNFIKAEVIDFNTMHWINTDEVNPLSAGAIVARLPHTGELRNLNFAKVLLCLGHNTPFLEARSEMESYQRDQIQDLHFLQPRLKLCFSFHSLATPLLNFPVITDVDGSVLIREDFYGNFKYYLTYEESEKFLDTDYDKFVDFGKEDPYPNLIHKGKLFSNYFNDVIKPRLVNRIPLMEDAHFNIATSGFESHNTHDGCPIISPHPFHIKVAVAGGFGSRMLTFGPAAAGALSELMVNDEEDFFDMTKFYWNRILKNRRVEEFRSLLNE